MPEFKENGEAKSTMLPANKGVDLRILELYHRGVVFRCLAGSKGLKEILIDKMIFIYTPIEAMTCKA